jgi:hypothetical protein
MQDVIKRYTILEKENKEGLYIIDFLKGTYIAYIENIEIINNIKEPVIDSEDLEKLGIYLLENIRKALNYSEEKTKKIIRYIYNKKIVKSKSFKVFILLLETYIIYNQIFLSAAVKNPILIDFFEDNSIADKNKVKIEIMKRLFNYLVGIKILETKLEISKLEKGLNDLFNIIDNYGNISNEDNMEPLSIKTMFKEILIKLISIKYENINDIKKLIDDEDMDYITLPLSNNQILGDGGLTSPNS